MKTEKDLARDIDVLIASTNALDETLKGMAPYMKSSGRNYIAVKMELLRLGDMTSWFFRLKSKTSDLEEHFPPI